MGFGKDGKGVIIRQQDRMVLLTLASKTVIKQDTPPAITEDFRILKTRILPNMEGATDAEADGPIIIGIADDELTVTEIKEALEATPLDPNDNVSNERAMRPVFVLGQLEFLAAASAGVLTAPQTPWIDKRPWTYSNAAGWTIFAYNVGGSALATGGIVNFYVEFYGVWVK